MSYAELVILVQVIAALLAALVIYHHAGYPLMLKLLSNLRARKQVRLALRLRHFRRCVGDSRVPSIHLFIPAYNESAVIRQKIDSLSWLDYPHHKLKVTILCDGCSDDTVEQARAGLEQFANQDVNVRLADFNVNRGKVVMVNEAIAECQADIIAFSDASAVLAADTLWRVAQHFMTNPGAGVVTGDYSLLQRGTEGEDVYWQYQNRIRAMESNLGSVLGAPGAFYAIRRELCTPLEPDTINDDFVLPMRAVAQGYQAVFDAELHILETEASSVDMDAKRRIRISQGNMQQILRLKRLLLPDLGWVSWMFASGKFLRVLMPYCMLAFLLISAWLAPYHWLWGLMYLGQLLVYLLACLHYLWADDEGAESILVNNKIVRLVSYLCIGHLMGLIGSAGYLLKTSYNSIKRLLGIKTQAPRSWQKIR